MDRLIMKSQSSIKKKRNINQCPLIYFIFFNMLLLIMLYIRYIYDKFKYSIDLIRIKLGHNRSLIY